MKVSFFEEFPTKENLSKLKLVTWPSKLYVAARSLKAFKKIAVKGCVYWPILDVKEGYWFSPWSSTAALERVYDEIKNEKIEVLIDLEPPKRRWQIVSRLFSFKRNKQIIEKILCSKAKITTVHGSYLPRAVLEFLGLAYPKSFGHTEIAMCYTSFERQILPPKTVHKRLRRKLKQYTHIGMGLIARGIHGREPIYGPTQLCEDLQIAKEMGVKEVIIFRLGGLNKQIAKVIKEVNV